MGNNNLVLPIQYLEDLTTALASNIKGGKFDNKKVIWLIKAWTKIGVLTNGPGYHRKASAYYVMKRDPPNSADTRSKTLLNALQTYLSVLQNSGSTGGDFFTRCDQGMLYFVWEYRQGLKGDLEKKFVHAIQEWMSLPEDKAMRQEVFNMDRSV